MLSLQPFQNPAKESAMEAEHQNGSNRPWSKKPKTSGRVNFKDGQLEELRRRWESLPDGPAREEVKAKLMEWSQFKPTDRKADR
jgi:hypothetical protein